VPRDPAELALLLRPLAAQIGADAARLDKDPDAYIAAFDRLSVTEYLDRHAVLIPQPWVRTLIETTIRTEFGSEPALATALQLLYNLPTVDGEAVEVLSLSDEAYCIQGGNSLLVDALGDALGGRVHTGHSLVSVRTAPGAPVRLGFRDGQAVVADQVILAIPFTVLRSVAIVADLPELLRRAIAELDLGRNEKVLGGFSRRVWQQPDGFVGEAWTDLGFAEVWDGSQHQPEREDGALIFFLGAHEVNTLKSGDSLSAQGRLHVERLDTGLPGVKAAATGRFARTAWTENPFVLGSYTNYRPGQIGTFGGLRWVESEDLSKRRELRAANLVFAGEHTSAEFFGYMNGGAQTGRLAAESVLRVAAEMEGPPGP
jgi:monoamine oxidase